MFMEITQGMDAHQSNDAMSYITTDEQGQLPEVVGYCTVGTRSIHHAAICRSQVFF